MDTQLGQRPSLQQREQADTSTLNTVGTPRSKTPTSSRKRPSTVDDDVQEAKLHKMRLSSELDEKMLHLAEEQRLLANTNYY